MKTTRFQFLLQALITTLQVNNQNLDANLRKSYQPSFPVNVLNKMVDMNDRFTSLPNINDDSRVSRIDFLHHIIYTLFFMNRTSK